MKAENRQNKNKVHQLENEIQHLREKIKSMEEIQGLADQQLQEADEEKETILAQLKDLAKKVGMSKGKPCAFCMLVTRRFKNLSILLLSDIAQVQKGAQRLNTTSFFHLNFIGCAHFSFFSCYFYAQDTERGAKCQKAWLPPCFLLKKTFPDSRKK